MSQLKDRSFQAKLKNAMNVARATKFAFYTQKLIDVNNTIIKEQTKLLQSWCQFGMRKAWLYYVDGTGALKDISADWHERELFEMPQMTTFRESELTAKLSAEEKAKRLVLLDYLRSMGIMNDDDANAEAKKRVLGYLTIKTQCDSFSQHWIKDASREADRMQRQIVSDQTALHEIEETNQNFFAALIESQRITQIIESIKAMPSVEDRFNAFVAAIRAMNQGIYGESRKPFKDQIANIVYAFVADPNGFKQSHLSISLTGPPGVGKTTVATYVGKILSLLGVLVKGTNISTHTRASMVGQYVGQTAAKVKAILRSNIEGIIFIDEAYALTQASGGTDSGDRLDQFGVEALNEIVGFLDKYKGQICIIAAGYKDEMKTYFFDVNPGMERRFKWFWDLPPFSTQELFCVAAVQLQSYDGKCAQRPTVRATMDAMVSAEGQLVLSSVLSDTTSLGQAFGLRDYFQNEGGDMENIAANIASSYYSLGSRQLSHDRIMQILWTFIKTRDGHVNLQRGLPAKRPPVFDMVSTVQLMKPDAQHYVIVGSAAAVPVPIKITIAVKEPTNCNFPQDLPGARPVNPGWC